MSFQDPPSRPRYPVLGQYEDERSAPGYTDGFDSSGHQANGSATGGWAAAPGSYSQGNAYAQPNGYQGNGYQAGAEFGGNGGNGTATMQRPFDNSWREGLDLSDDGWARPPRQPASGGMLAGAFTGFLAVAVLIGVATLVAAFVKPPATPVMAMGQAFINHAPSSLKSFALHSGHERKMLFGVMYMILAIIAMVIGVFAYMKVAIGVTGIALIGLFGAYFTVNQPGGHSADAVPAVIGAIAGMVALTFLIRSFYADNTTRAPARRRA